MWIERLLSEVQLKGAVICRENLQQGSGLCESQFSRLGESGTNHPRVQC